MAPNSPLQPPSLEPPRKSWFTIFLVTIGLMVGASLLLLLPTGFIGPVIVFGGLIFFGIIGFHYVVWGRWINRLLKEELAETDDPPPRP